MQSDFPTLGSFYVNLKTGQKVQLYMMRDTHIRQVGIYEQTTEGFVDKKIISMEKFKKEYILDK